MPKLRASTPQEIIRLLEQKGFVLDRIRGSHHIYYHPVSKRRAVVPLHHGELPKGTLLEILTRAGLTKEDLRNLR